MREEISQADVARLLKVHPAQLTLIVARGELTSRREGRRIWFKAKEVENYRVAHPNPIRRRRRGIFLGRAQRVIEGPRAAVVFSMLKDGAHLADIVVATKLAPDEVQTLWEYYTLGFDGIARAKKQHIENIELQRHHIQMQKDLDRERWMRFQERMKKLGPPTRPDLMKKAAEPSAASDRSSPGGE